MWDDESRGWVVKPAGVHNPADYRPFNLDQAAMQSAFRTQALADSKKRAAPFAWPARKGHSSEQCKRQALRSVERGILRANQGPRLPLAARPAELNRFNAIQVPELPDDLALGINPVGSRADENQFQGEWPWEPTASKTRSQAPPVPERTSRYVRQHHPLDDHIEMYLDQASADGKRGRSTTGVRAWFAFCQDVVGTPADRPIDPFITPLFDKLEDEWLAMRFVCALVSDRGVTPDTAAKYFSSVQGWHLREHGVKLAGGMKLERIPQMVKGMKRVLGSIPKKLRRGVAPQALQKAMDLVLDPKNPTHANIRAALACALQGLLRSCEYTSKDGKANRFTINRSDIAELTKDRLVFWMHPGKNMNHIGGKPVRWSSAQEVSMSTQWPRCATYSRSIRSILETLTSHLYFVTRSPTLRFVTTRSITPSNRSCRPSERTPPSSPRTRCASAARPPSSPPGRTKPSSGRWDGGPPTCTGSTCALALSNAASGPAAPAPSQSQTWPACLLTRWTIIEESPLTSPLSLSLLPYLRFRGYMGIASMAGKTR